MSSVVVAEQKPQVLAGPPQYNSPSAGAQPQQPGRGAPMMYNSAHPAYHHPQQYQQYYYAAAGTDDEGAEEKKSCCKNPVVWILLSILGAVVFVGIIVAIIVANDEKESETAKAMRLMKGALGRTAECPVMTGWPSMTSGLPEYKGFDDLDALFRTVNSTPSTGIVVQTNLAKPSANTPYVTSAQVVAEDNFTLRSAPKKFPQDKKTAFAGLHAWRTKAMGYADVADAFNDKTDEADGINHSGGEALGLAEKALQKELQGDMKGRIVRQGGERWVPIAWDIELRNSKQCKSASASCSPTDKTLKTTFKTLHADQGGVYQPFFMQPGKAVHQNCIGDNFRASTYRSARTECTGHTNIRRSLLHELLEKYGEVDPHQDGSKTAGGAVFPVGFNLWTLIEDHTKSFPLVFPDLPNKIYQERASLEEKRKNLKASYAKGRRVSLFSLLRAEKKTMPRADPENELTNDQLRSADTWDAVQLLSASALQPWSGRSAGETDYTLYGDVDDFAKGDSYVFKTWDMRPGGLATFHGAAARAVPLRRSGFMSDEPKRRSTETRFVLVRKSALDALLRERGFLEGSGLRLLQKAGFNKDLLID